MNNFQKEWSMRGLFKNAPLGRNQIIGLTIKKTLQLYSSMGRRGWGRTERVIYIPVIIVDTYVHVVAIVPGVGRRREEN